MDLSTQLPPELLAPVAPAGRAPPELLQSPDGDADSTPFDALLLTLAGTAIPSGDPLPGSGKGLPSAPADLPDAAGPDAAAPDVLAASELLALIVPPSTAGPAVPAAAPAAGEPPAASPAAHFATATLEPLASAPSSAEPPAIVLPAPLPGPAPAEAPANVSDSAAAAARPLDGFGQPLDVSSERGEAAPPQPPAVSASDRAPAPAAVAQASPALDAVAAEAAAAPPAPRPVELRPSTERRAPSVSASLPADPTRASPASSAQGFDLVSLASGADRPVAPQRAETAEPLPVPATPSATPAGSPDAQPLTPPHTPGVSLPHAAAALDASSQTAVPSSTQQGGSVDTTAARWHDALASRLQWLVDHDVGEARIKLNPPELGALDVKISLHDDKTFVQVTAHNAAARDELAQSLPRLRELLSANGLELGGATVSGGRDQGAGRYPGAEPAVRPAGFSAADPEPAARALARPTVSSRIDVFA